MLKLSFMILGLFFQSFYLYAEGNDAKAAAHSWLATVDNGEYEKSWNEASNLFKDNVTVRQWKTAMENAHKSFGKVMQRDYSKAIDYDQIPNFPKGNYTVILYDSVFESSERAVEVVTLTVEENKWSVVGYVIK